MPKAYAIFTEQINDRAGYEEYMRMAVGPTIKYGVKPLAIDDEPDVLEGVWHGPRTIILEFESAEAAYRWYHSPEYQALVKVRRAAVDSNAVIVAGFEMPVM